MNIDAAIPPPPQHISTETPTGYDIPRDTISKEFLKSARTARQSVESNTSSIGTNFNDYLIPSTSAKLVPESPRIVITRPDDDPLPSPLDLKLDADMLSRLSHMGDGTAPPRPTDRSFLLAVALAVVVVVIVFLIIYLFFQLE